MKRPGSISLVLFGVLVLVIAGGAGWKLRKHQPELRANIKVLGCVQADYSLNDRDGNGVKDFWKGDVAGFYTGKTKAGKPLELIDRKIALADARPLSDLSLLGKRAPIAGYWYQAIPHEGETTPDPQRFAYCAFPADPKADKFTFIIDENKTVYWKETTVPPAFFPADLAKQGWEKLE
jgi:hypothetical protein